MRRTLMRATAGAAVATLALAGCGGSRYEVRLDLDNAGGLRTGSLVQVGGVPVGKVVGLDLQHDDRVRATLRLDDGRGPIGRDARAAIASRNLLGEKYINLTPGDRRRPLPSGASLPATRVQASVDLDQILDVLTPTTRAKVSLLIDEAGAGLTGRGRDLNAFLRQFAPTLDKATGLLNQVVTDNHTLAQVIERSDRFIATLARKRSELGRLVGTAGAAADTFAAKRTQLTAALDRAPGALTQLRRTLAEVRQTAAPLGKAARAAGATAPQLTNTLAAVEPFRQAAIPTLDQLRAAAPTLIQLGRRATPVITRARPTLVALRRFATTVAPVSRTLDVMIDDLMAALHGWSRAIQARDGLSHMFRAKVAINPESLNAIISRLSQPPARKKRPAKTPKPNLSALLPGVTRKPSTGATGGAAGLGAAVDNVGSTVTGLLDYLLGK